MESRRAFITGDAGFIGFHLSRLLLDQGWVVKGFDALTDYYDVKLKKDRRSILSTYDNYHCVTEYLQNYTALKEQIYEFMPNVVIHLAAQAGVRYSLENPGSYIESNIVGTYNLLEVTKNIKLNHLILASTSSVYGGNEDLPFSEKQKADSQLTIYSATKKSVESLAHSYAHIWRTPTTLLRFFTVYGPWGRPDLALFKFVEAILVGKEIDIYNRGKMYRDFTYVDDLVKSIMLLIDAIPVENPVSINDNLSKVAPCRVVNIGNSSKIPLMSFINEIENQLKITAKKNYLPMQIGDVPATLADVTLLNNLIGYTPNTDISCGIENFIKWYLNYYNK